MWSNCWSSSQVLSIQCVMTLCLVVTKLGSVVTIRECVIIIDFQVMWSIARSRSIFSLEHTKLSGLSLRVKDTLNGHGQIVDLITHWCLLDIKFYKFVQSNNFLLILRKSQGQTINYKWQKYKKKKINACVYMCNPFEFYSQEYICFSNISRFERLLCLSIPFIIIDVFYFLFYS